MTCRCRRHCRAFTLIEMIGVLAVIAILASLLIPKIFEAINNARINKVVASCHTIKTATLEHYGKFLSLGSSNGIPLTGDSDDFDKILLAEGFIDKPFAPGMGETELIRIRDVSSLDASSPVNPKTPSSGYDLNGDGDNDIVGARYLVEVIIWGPTDADVRALNDRLDGPELGEESGNSGMDRKGRAIYDIKDVGSHTRIVRIYLTHY